MKLKKGLILLALAGTVFGLSAGFTKVNASNMVVAAPTPQPPEPPRPTVPSFTINYISPIDDDRVFYDGELITNQDFKGEICTSIDDGDATTATYNPLVNSLTPFNDTMNSSGKYPKTIHTQLASGINNLTFTYTNSVSNHPLYNLELNAEDCLFNYKKLKKITSVDDINDEDIYYFAGEYNDYTFLFDRKLEQYSYADTMSSFQANSRFDCIIRNTSIENNNQYLLASREMHDNLMQLKFENIDRSESGLLKNVNVYSESVSYTLSNNEQEITGKTYFIKGELFSHNYSVLSKRDYTISFRDNKAVLMTSGGWVNDFGVQIYSTHFWPKLEIFSSEEDKYDTAGITIYKLDFTLDDLAEEFNDGIDNNCSHYGITTSDDLNNIKKIWENASSDYKTLLKDSEKEKISETQGEIGTMLSKYDYMLYTYGSTLELENFLGREIVKPEEPDELTAEDVAEEFNAAMELNCDSNGNTSSTNLDNIETAWSTAVEQYSQLSYEEKAKFNASSGSSSSEITDLTGYTWVPNDSISWPGKITYNIKATLYSENGKEDTTETLEFITKGSGPDSVELLQISSDAYYANYMYVNSIYQLPNIKGIHDGTSDDPFKQMTFTGGTDATNATLITWLQANGTLTKPTQEIDPAIEEMLSKYDYIYGKYGSTIGEDFLRRFSNYDPTAQGNKSKILNIKDINNSTWIIAVVSIIGLTSVGAYFFYRKRKEE